MVQLLSKRGQRRMRKQAVKLNVFAGYPRIKA
jgi:hypothetical protein